MKILKRFMFCVAVAVVLTLCTSAVHAQTQVQATIPTFNVVINGQVLNYENQLEVQYPFLLYKDITYFPMTYFDCCALGVYNKWTPKNGNEISAGLACTDYTELIAIQKKKDGFVANATVAEGKIAVNGNVIDNASEEYPILSFDNVLYFPMTWRWTTEFGWFTNFSHNTFSVYTADCPNINQVYKYSYLDFGQKQYYPIDELYARGGYDESSENLKYKFAAWESGSENNIEMFGIASHEEDFIEVRNIHIAKELYDAYVAIGWKTFHDCFVTDDALYRLCSSAGQYKRGIDEYMALIWNEIYMHYGEDTAAREVAKEILTARRDLLVQEWRNKAGTSVVVTNTAVYKYDPEVDVRVAYIYFSNISDKTVSAVKMNCIYRDANGRAVKVNGSDKCYVACEGIQLGFLNENYYCWDIPQGYGIVDISDVKITEVVFADGTVWRG